jgi:hypothetical protein
MRRSITAAVMAAAVVLTTGSSASAEEAPSTGRDTGASSSTQLERVSAYTQPSVVYVGIEWTGRGHRAVRHQGG